MFELTADANGFFSIPDLLFDGVAGLPSLELPWLPSSQAVNLDPDPTGLLDDAALLLPSAQSTPQQSEVPMVAASPAVFVDPDPPFLPPLPHKRSRLSLRRRSVIVGGGGQSGAVKGAGILMESLQLPVFDWKPFLWAASTFIALRLVGRVCMCWWINGKLNWVTFMAVMIWMRVCDCSEFLGFGLRIIIHTAVL